MSKPKVAVITGITGQDGSYLAELLLEKEYEVIGIARRSSTDTHYHRLDGVMGADSFKLVIGDVTDASSVASIVSEYQPDELYNLAAQSFVKDAFDQPNYTWQVNAQGVLNILEAIRKYSPKTRMLQASTSEMFGRSYSVGVPAKEGIYWIQHFNMDDTPPHTLVDGCGVPFQNEQTPFQPQSPYSIGKVAAHYAMQLYRRTYNLHLSCSICFNHESERRGKQFVTRKITDWVGKFHIWKNQNPGCSFDFSDEERIFARWGDSNFSVFPKLRLGNLDSKRDWGHAEDYVRAMWMMLQQDEPGDYVISTERTHSVGDFVLAALQAIGLNGVDILDYVYQDPQFMRPAEVNYLLGQATQAHIMLGWEPEIKFEELVKRMVENDIRENEE